MITIAPRHLPEWLTCVQDVGSPNAPSLAKHLGVTERTVYNWQLANNAPRAAHLALFWDTRWGRSAIDAKATNDARMYYGLAQSLRARVELLEAQSRRFEGFTAGAANELRFYGR